MYNWIVVNGLTLRQHLENSNKATSAEVHRSS